VAKKKKGGHGGGGGGGHDAGGGMRWLLTYSDVVTLLLALFVYLFSISTVNVAKFRQFGEAFAEFFDYGASSSIRDTNAAMGAGNKNSMRQPPRWRVKEKANRNSVMSSGADNDASAAEREKVEKLKQILMKELKAFLDLGNISISGRDDDLVLQLRDASLFEPGSAEIKNEMKTALLKIASQIRALPNDIRVEGHTDNTPLRGGRFGSNWHLSGSRAASVVNFLAVQGGIDPKRLSLAGFAEFQPLVPNYPNYGNPLNRRVEILILASTSRTDDESEFQEDDE
jgi:chemotaxis protein MotB